jgi:hypothetical protein
LLYLEANFGPPEVNVKEAIFSGFNRCFKEGAVSWALVLVATTVHSFERVARSEVLCLL